MSLQSHPTVSAQNSWDRRKFADLIEKFEDQKQALLKAANELQANLPLKYLAQQAHFTTPASNYEMLKKAVEGGMGAVPKFLAKFDLSLSDLGDTLGISTEAMEEVLHGHQQPPLVIRFMPSAACLAKKMGRTSCVPVLCISNC